MSQNVSIYFSDTGGGHRSAAEALEAAIGELVERSGNRPAISIIKDSIAEKSHPINRHFVELYNYLLRHHQPLMKYYYWFIHAVKPECGLNIALSEDYFSQLLLEHQPSVIVSVHPMTNHCMDRAMRRLNIRDRLKLVVVVTDPNAALWRAWACCEADLIIVPNASVRNKLIDYGVSAQKIETLGMPVHPYFLKPPSLSRQEFLLHLGLSPELTTVCINAGWAGGGNMLKVYRSLSKVKIPLQAIFLCGHHIKLYEQAMTSAAESEIPTAVLPFHDCMSDLMAAVDLMVTKGGGLTAFQGLARRLPLAFDCITEPMPQEKGTIKMLVEQQLAFALHQPEDIVGILSNFTFQPDRTRQTLPGNYDLNLTDGAVYSIARRILEFCTPPVILEPAQVTEVLHCDLPPKSLAKKTAEEK